MSETKKRLYYLDFAKLFAIFLVINSHFVPSFYNNPPYFITCIMNGLSGKFGVIMFAEIAGYFAYMSGKNKSLWQYTIERYFSFFDACFVACVVYYLVNYHGCRDVASWGMVIGQSVFLGDFFCPSLWFLSDFLFGSILCFLLGKYEVVPIDSFILFLILFSKNYPFVACCVFGAILPWILDCHVKAFDLKITKVFMFIFFFVFVTFYRKENDARYFVDTFRVAILLLFIKKNSFIVPVYENKIVQFIGSKTISLLIAHNIVTFFLSNSQLSLALQNITYTLYYLDYYFSFANGGC